MQTTNKPNKITIEPCGKLLGHTSFDSKDTVLLTKSDIIKQIMILLASNLFEIYFCHEPSTAFVSDYDMIKSLIEQMKKSYMINQLLTIKEEYIYINTMLTSMSDIINVFIRDHENFINFLHDKLIEEKTINSNVLDELILGSLSYYLKINISSSGKVTSIPTSNN